MSEASGVLLRALISKTFVGRAGYVFLGVRWECKTVFKCLDCFHSACLFDLLFHAVFEYH